jgi:YfiR/HmsC-like
VIKRLNINKFKFLVVKIISLLLFSFIALQAYSQTSIYVLKAVYLEKFSRFVTWPEECSMDDSEKPFVISVIGKTPLYKNLEQIYSMQKINNKKVEIRKINNLYEIKNSHILVIAESEKRNLLNILALTEKLPVLTVSESPNFANEGVLINFFEERNKLKFEVNETAVIKSPLQMSFYLMNSAKIVKPVKDN